MSTCCTTEWSYPRGTKEFLTVEVESKNGTMLDAQPVEMSLDGITWEVATWLGSAGTTRDAQAWFDFGDYYKGTYHVRVRVLGGIEEPIIYVGTLEVVAQ